MASEQYQRQLSSPLWQRKRLEIFTRDNWTCQSCKSNDKELHVHHNYYEQGKLAWEYPDDCYLTLCYECHEKIEATKGELLIIEKEIEVRKKSRDSYGVVHGVFIGKSTSRDERIVSVMFKSETYYPYLCNYIYKVEDYKGCLSVYWRIFPSEEQKNAITKAWEDHSEYLIDHHLPQSLFSTQN